MSPLVLAAIAALAAASPPASPAGPSGAGPAPAQTSRVKGRDVSAFPPEQRARWPLVVQKCGRCHSMDVALNPGYTPAEWKASMRRMLRLPGAAITGPQAGEIMEFLRFYSTGAARR